MNVLVPYQLLDAKSRHRQADHGAEGLQRKRQRKARRTRLVHCFELARNISGSAIRLRSFERPLAWHFQPDALAVKEHDLGCAGLSAEIITKDLACQVILEAPTVAFLRPVHHSDDVFLADLLPEAALGDPAFDTQLVGETM